MFATNSGCASRKCGKCGEGGETEEVGEIILPVSFPNFLVAQV